MLGHGQDDRDDAAGPHAKGPLVSSRSPHRAAPVLLAGHAVETAMAECRGVPDDPAGELQRDHDALSSPPLSSGPAPPVAESSAGPGGRFLKIDVDNDAALAELVLTVTAVLRPRLAAYLRHPRDAKAFGVQSVALVDRYKNDYVTFPDEGGKMEWDIFCPNKVLKLPEFDPSNATVHLVTYKHEKSKGKWRTALRDGFPDNPSEVTENEVQRVVLDRRNHFERLLGGPDSQDAVPARRSQSRASSRGSSTSGGSLKRSRSRASSRSSVGSAPLDSISRSNRPASSHGLHTVEGQPAFALPGLPVNSPISAGSGFGLVPQINEPLDGVISPSAGRRVDEQRLRVLVADYFPEMEQHNIESAYFSIPSHQEWEQRFALHELTLRRARSDIRAHFAYVAASFFEPGGFGHSFRSFSPPESAADYASESAAPGFTAVEPLSDPAFPTVTTGQLDPALYQMMAFPGPEAGDTGVGMENYTDPPW